MIQMSSSPLQPNPSCVTHKGPITFLYFLLHAGQLGIPQSKEIVLEYVVERKRMDDLAGSITDGRFRDQKVLCLTRFLRVYALNRSYLL